jgi:endonuclease YncB( thermonuclease family)
MPYTLLRGKFVIRYADVPQEGPEPDGDTVKFMPDTPALVEALPRRSGRPPRINSRGISVRLEAIDALETHFAETHQQLASANRARDVLLDKLGFTNVRFFDDRPNKVESADQDSLAGYVLSNGIDANGRLIGFIHPGVPEGGDGASVYVREADVDASVNGHLLAAGLVYPAFYGTLPASLREHLAGASRAARTANMGIWAHSTADPDGPATIRSVEDLKALVIWPKLFRRLVPYLAAGNTSFDGFDAWLRADPVDRDDTLLFLNPVEAGNMHDLVTASGHRIRINRWPEDFIIEPDPAPPGTNTGPRNYAAGDIAIVAVLPNPFGPDTGRETVTLVNATGAAVALDGWQVVDGSGRRQTLSGELPAGESLRVILAGGPQLGNVGGAVTLLDRTGATIDRITYTEAQVQPGRTVIVRG